MTLLERDTRHSHEVNGYQWQSQTTLDPAHPQEISYHEAKCLWRGWLYPSRTRRA